MKTTSFSLKFLVQTLSILFFFCGIFLCNSYAKSIDSVSVNNVPSVIKKVSSSVVSLYVDGVIYTKEKEAKTQDDVFTKNYGFVKAFAKFKKLSGSRQNENTYVVRKRFKGIASGVVIDAKNGYIVTNNHVVSNANRVAVKTIDNYFYEAKIIGKDACTDLAVIQIESGEHLKDIKISDYKSLEVGDCSIAIGNPYGLNDTSSVGIISAIGRNHLAVSKYENFIQTDAAINNGNSGGALVNLKGELIGVNSAILTPENGSVGLGFAIPGYVVKKISQQLISHGSIHRGFIGVEGISVDQDVSEAMNLSKIYGAFITSVSKNTPAKKAGLRAGDVIVSLDDKVIDDYYALSSEVMLSECGSKVKIGVLRNNKVFFTDVAIQDSKQKKSKVLEVIDHFFPGIILGDYLQYVEGQDNKCIKVLSVDKGSVSDHIGFKKGDKIIALNNQNIFSLEDLKDFLIKRRPIVLVKVLRDKNVVYLVLESS